ncbi:MAG: hypothetical protein NC907_04535 [Candidatus Omnitrophica bacterium]|nr:hypothetical protein [Candidatus Omnitrophota bacterium]
MKEIPRDEYPRPEFLRKKWINLNGEWYFEIDISNTGIDKKFFLPERKFKEKIIVPFAPESSLSGIKELTLWFLCGIKRKSKFQKSGKTRGFL